MIDGQGDLHGVGQAAATFASLSAGLDSEEECGLLDDSIGRPPSFPPNFGGEDCHRPTDLLRAVSGHLHLLGAAPPSPPR